MAGTYRLIPDERFAVDAVFPDGARRATAGEEGPGVPDLVREYRRKFARAPLGRWTTSSEYGPWPKDNWEFHSDGTGMLFQYAGFGDNVVRFEWREAGECTIQLRVTDWGDMADDDAVHHQDEEWETITYDFRMIEHPGYGPPVGMFQVPEGPVVHFWWTFHDYLQFAGETTT